MTSTSKVRPESIPEPSEALVPTACPPTLASEAGGSATLTDTSRLAAPVQIVHDCFRGRTAYLGPRLTAEDYAVDDTAEILMAIKRSKVWR